MMKKQSDFHGRLQVITFNTALFFAAAVIFAAGWYALRLSLPDSGGWILLYATLFLLATGLVWAWLLVMVKIPQELAARYDDIKNRIAAGEIADSSEFAAILARFLVNYFSFYRFDVTAAQVKVKEQQAINFSESRLPLELPDEEELTRKSKETEAVVKLGRIVNGKGKYYGYLVPVWFNDQWLGFFAVYTNTPLLKVYQN
jgi:hypothetical protein